MRRLHLFEFHDFRWYPSAWRNALTDIISFFAIRFGLYQPIVPKLNAILKTMRCRRIVDLCSGAAGSAISVLEQLDEIDGQPTTITLTDKYPYVPAFRYLAAKSPGRILYSEASVDATNVPEVLTGFRTLFASFHHFDVDTAREILRDAVRKNQGIGVLEHRANIFKHSFALCRDIIRNDVAVFIEPRRFNSAKPIGDGGAARIARGGHPWRER